MKALRSIAISLAAVAALSACAHSGYYNIGQPGASDDQRRIWVVHEGELYRCADGTSGNEPPKPLCIRAVKAP